MEPTGQIVIRLKVRSYWNLRPMRCTTRTLKCIEDWLEEVLTLGDLERIRRRFLRIVILWYITIPYIVIEVLFHSLNASNVNLPLYICRHSRSSRALFPMVPILL